MVLAVRGHIVKGPCDVAAVPFSIKSSPVDLSRGRIAAGTKEEIWATELQRCNFRFQ